MNEDYNCFHMKKVRLLNMKRRNYSYITNNHPSIHKSKAIISDNKQKINLKREKNNMSTWFETNETNDNTTTNCAMSKSKVSTLKTPTYDYNKEALQSVKLTKNKKKIMMEVIDNTINSLKLLRKILNKNITQLSHSNSNHNEKRVKRYDVNKSIEINPICLRMYNSIHYKAHSKLHINDTFNRLPTNQCQTNHNTNNHDTNANSHCQKNTIIIKANHKHLNLKKIQKQSCFSLILNNNINQAKKKSRMNTYT